MANEIVNNTVQRAVQQAYADWAVEHPNLAAVIDQIVITERSAERLRETDEYKQAVAGYHESRNELDLFNQLLALAGPIIQQLLG
jgi:hypothetical protein